METQGAEKDGSGAGIPPPESEAVDSSSEDELFVAEPGYAQLCDDGDDDGEPEHDVPGARTGLEGAVDRRLPSGLGAQGSPDQQRQPEPAEDPHTPCAGSGPIRVSTTKMSAQHVEQIKRTMARIQLHEDAVPEWAWRIPEEAWMPVRK